jgi:hypothetical protein
MKTKRAEIFEFEGFPWPLVGMGLLGIAMGLGLTVVDLPWEVEVVCLAVVYALWRLFPKQR